ncbi:MAG: tetratricopeptide repeat protein [Candidatus Aureabacteria bacterium]|nr:tetratricopeptide repeat protein [Candidatus Auribacterota bacterium]
MRNLINGTATVLFFLAVAAFGCFQIIDMDVWLYLRTGEYICSTLRAPRADFFSYTAAGQPWIDIHWLAQVVLWLVYAACGAVGLCVLRLVLVLGIFGILYRCCRGYASRGITIAVLTFALLIANDGFLIKPYLISLLLVVSFLAILEHARTSCVMALWPLVPLQVLWANMHPSFFLGPFLVLVYLVDALIRSRAHGAGLVKRLAAFVALLSAACLLTPYGFSLFEQPWTQTTTRIFTETVIPWTPAPSTFPAPFSAFFFTLMFALSLAAFLINVRKIRPADVIIFAVFAWLAMKSRRHLPLFALLSAPGLCFNLGSFEERLQRRFSTIAGFCSVSLSLIMIPLLCLLFEQVVSNSYYYQQRSLRRFGMGKSAIAFPDGAIDFLELSAPGERIFCNYDIGSYVAGRLYPHHRVFMDGRNLVYGETLFRKYLQAMADVESLNKVADEYGVNALLLAYSSRDVKVLLPSLWKSPVWTPVYADDRAMIFLRSGAAPHRSRLDLAACRLSGISSGDPFPLSELRAGELFYTLGFTKCAEDMFRKALECYKSLPEARNFLGMIALQRGDGASARAEFMKACEGSRSFAEPHINLVTALLGEGMAEDAEREAEEAIRIAPSAGRGYGARGLARICRGKLPEAQEDLREAVALDPGEAEYHSNLGIVQERLEEPESARKEYEEACVLSKTYFEPRYNLALLQEKRGNIGEAIVMYREALALNPRHGGARRNLAALYLRQGDRVKARGQLEEALRIDPEDRGAQEMLRKVESQ